ncbi:MAG: aminoglycoside 6'-N-acetyltransferase [Clostridium sp.]
MIKNLKTKNDIKSITSLALLLWPHSSLKSHEKTFEKILTSDKDAVFIYFIDKSPIGFAHVSLRYDYVEGTKTSPVGYLEGIFIKDTYRNNGFAKELLLVSQNWTKSKGCLEFASDCELDNLDSFKFHLKLGFSEANKIICFKKNL